MKKLLSMILVLSMVFSLAACGGKNSTTGDGGKTDGLQVDEGLLNVDITLPSSMFEGMTDQDILAEAKEDGYKCTVNEDGSVTYTISKKQQRELLAEIKAGIPDTIEACLNGEDEIASFEEITYNDDLSEFKIKVNENYSAFDMFAALSFMMTSVYYQLFSGVSEDNMDCVITFVDVATGTEVDSFSYSDFLEE